MKKWKESRVVFAGDFNARKNTTLYHTLFNNKGEYSDDVSIYADFYSVLNENFCDVPNFKSGYKLANGSEAKFTNVYINESKNIRFKDTIDYILLSPGIYAMSSVVGLIPKKDITPNAICPSDHLPLSITIRIN